MILRTSASVVLLALASAFHGLAATPADQPAPSTSDSELVRRLEVLEREVAELRRRLESGATPAPSAEISNLRERLEALEGVMAELKRDFEVAAEDSRITAEAVDDLSEAELRGAHLTVYGSIVGADYEGKNSVFDGEAVELVVSGRPHDRLGFFTEIEFERAAQVGGERGGEVVVEQAYGTFSFGSGLALKAGIVLMPFGNYNLDHYAPTREVISRPLVSHAVVPSDWTDNGFGVVGRSSLGGGWMVEYEAYVVAGLGSDASTLDVRAARQPFGVDNNNNKATIGRVGLNRRGQFELGASYYLGAYDDSSRLDLEGWAGHLATQLGPLGLAGEYNRFTVEQIGLEDGTLEGYYARAVYDLFRGLLRRGRHGATFPDARLSLVVQYGEVELNPPATLDQEGRSESRWTLGLNYRPSNHWVVKINHEDNESVGQPILHGSSEAWLAAVGFVY
jgi:hypothetical protein